MKTPDLHKSIRGRKVHIVWWYAQNDTSTTMMVFQDKEDADATYNQITKQGSATVVALREEEIK